HHLLAGQPLELQVRVRLLPDHRQRLAERDRAMELRLVARRAPVRVIAVLLPPARIEPRRLDVTARVRADPDARPGGRDPERLDPLERRRVADRATLDVLVGEVLRRLPEAGEAGPVVVDVAKPALR